MSSSSEEHELSGLSESELQHVYNCSLKLKKSVVYQKSEEHPNRPAPEDFEQQLNRLLSLLRSKLEGPESFTSSSMTTEDWTS